MPLPVVAIVGRPNVGKSTLFNRFLRRQTAVVDPRPGVTRDRHYADAVWNGVRFTLVDTGGYLPDREGDALTAAVREQTLVAAGEADLVLMLVDARAETSEVERELARILLKSGTPLLFVANKVDDPTLTAFAWELSGIGLGNPFAVSAATGYQVAELLDEVVSRLRKAQPVQPEATPGEDLALAVIGAPNTGKSSLVNRLAQSERMVVSDIPGTTRDSVDTVVRWEGRTIRLVDTAGLRRKRYGLEGLDFYCTLRALRALERCQVAVVMVDGTVGLTAGDIRLVRLAAEKGAGVIIAVNKWDAVAKDPKSADRWTADWKRRVPGLAWVPVLFISALTGQRAVKVIGEAFAVAAERERRIPTAKLNDEVGAELARTPPPAIKGKFIRVKYVSQVRVSPPKFVVFANHANLIREPYRRFVEKHIRRRYRFQGVPLDILFREK